MSFILDALKKSENERQRTIGPSLADAPARRVQNERPWWVIAVAALLVINLGVLVVVLARRDDTSNDVPVASPATQAPVATPPPAATTAPAHAVMPAAPGTTAQHHPTLAPTNPEVRSLAEEAGGYYDDVSPFELSGPAAAANVPAGSPMVQPLDGPTVAPAPNGAAVSQSIEPPAEARGAEPVPTISSVIASGVAIPDLHLDIHVYSAQPAERFIFVNMRKYHEGQTLNEGPVIEHITREGAILSYQGRRFLLPRQ